MSDESNRSGDKRLAKLPDWADCDFFCIQAYAGTGALPCGWRGKQQDVLRDHPGAKMVCPRCGCATLLRIPLDWSDGQSDNKIKP